MSNPPRAPMTAEHGSGTALVVTFTMSRVMSTALIVFPSMSVQLPNSKATSGLAVFLNVNSMAVPLSIAGMKLIVIMADAALALILPAGLTRFSPKIESAVPLKNGLEIPHLAAGVVLELHGCLKDNVGLSHGGERQQRQQDHCEAEPSVDSLRHS